MYDCGFESLQQEWLHRIEGVDDIWEDGIRGEAAIGAVKDVVELFMTEEYREQREKFLKVGLGTINRYELTDMIAKGEFSTDPEDMLRYFLSELSNGLEEGEIEDDYYIGYDSLKVYLE